MKLIDILSEDHKNHYLANILSPGTLLSMIKYKERSRLKLFFPAIHPQFMRGVGKPEIMLSKVALTTHPGLDSSADIFRQTAYTTRELLFVERFPKSTSIGPTEGGDVVLWGYRRDPR